MFAAGFSVGSLSKVWIGSTVTVWVLLADPSSASRERAVGVEEICEMGRFLSIKIGLYVGRIVD